MRSAPRRGQVLVEAVAALPEAVLKEHGSVTVLVNNAGVALGGTFEQVPPEDFEWMFGINSWGVADMARAFLPVLRWAETAQTVTGILRREKRVLAGRDARQAALIRRLFPVGYWPVMAKFIERKVRGLSKSEA